MAIFLSVCNVLKNPYIKNPRKYTKAKYAKIKVGNPISIRYLHFYFNSKELKEKNEIMITHHIKTKPTKDVQPEIVTYFDPKFKVGNEGKHLASFSAARFGHELIYYSKSYSKEEITLTTNILKLHNLGGVVNISKILTSIVPIAIGATAGAASGGAMLVLAPILQNLLSESILKKFGKSLQELIFPTKSLASQSNISLKFDVPYTPKLVSGRFVFVSGEFKQEKLKNFMENFRLNYKNRLVDKQGVEYTKSSYFVCQVNGKKQEKFENFEYAKGSADLLTKLNRKDKTGISELLGDLTELIKNNEDLKAIKELQKLKGKTDDKSKEKSQNQSNKLSKSGKQLASSLKLPVT